MMMMMIIIIIITSLSFTNIFTIINTSVFYTTELVK